MSGQTLGYNGVFVIGARQSAELSFTARAASWPGDYVNHAFATPYDPSFGQPSASVLVQVIGTPLVVTKTADIPETTVDSRDGYTITIANPNPVSVALETVDDVLPDGFSYVPGSTSGDITGDPGIDGQRLTWGGTTVPANGSVTLHFEVTTASEPGLYWNRASAFGALPVTPTGFTAPIRLRGAPTLVVHPALADVDLDGRVNAPRMTATLSWIHGPLAGREIVFTTVDGHEICRAVTDQHGHAGCGGPFDELNLLPELGYDGTFAGDEMFTAAFDHGPLVEVLDTEVM